MTFHPACKSVIFSEVAPSLKSMESSLGMEPKSWSSPPADLRRRAKFRFSPEWDSDLMQSVAVWGRGGEQWEGRDGREGRGREVAEVIVEVLAD